MKKRLKKKFHKEYLDDIILEISQSSCWRKKLFEAPYFTKVEISKTKECIPFYVRDVLNKYNLRFFVSKVRLSPEPFSSDLVIFKFEASEFPNIVGYSGNNENII